MWTSPPRSLRLRRSPGVAAVLGCALFLAPPVHASSTSDGFGLGFVAAAGHVNNVSLSVNPAGTHLRTSDPGHANTPGGTCVAVGGNSTQVDCPGSDMPLAIIQLLDMDDSFTATTLSSLPLFVDGGTGVDQITGGGADDKLGGAAGNDTANGGGGNDVYDDEVDITLLFGGIHSDGDGNDTFNGNSGSDMFLGGTSATADDTGRGSDTFNGGADFDTADYSARTAPLTITADAGTGNDGATGEGDTIISAERILGGSAADVMTAGAAGLTLVGNAGGDTLTGGAAPDRLVGDAEDGGGTASDDTLDGGAGADVLIGGPGRDTASYASRSAAVTVTIGGGSGDGAAGENDDVRADIERVVGGTGADTLTGDAGANALLGADGGDTLTGGDGSDSVDAGSGDDRVEARDLSPDSIVCGAGVDTVIADAVDTVAADCEVIDRPAVPVDGGGTGGAGGAGAGAGGAGSGGGTGQGAGGATGQGTAVVAPVVLGGKPLRLTSGRRVKVTVTCPGAGDCAGALTLTLDRGKRTLATLPYGVPAGNTRTFTLVLGAKAKKRLKPGKKNAVTVSATRTGAPPAAKAGKL